MSYVYSIRSHTLINFVQCPKIYIGLFVKHNVRRRMSAYSERTRRMPNVILTYNYQRLRAYEHTLMPYAVVWQHHAGNTTGDYTYLPIPYVAYVHVYNCLLNIRIYSRQLIPCGIDLILNKVWVRQKPDVMSWFAEHFKRGCTWCHI